MSRVIHKDGPVAAVEMPEDKLWGCVGGVETPRGKIGWLMP